MHTPRRLSRIVTGLFGLFFTLTFTPLFAATISPTTTSPQAKNTPPLLTTLDTSTATTTCPNLTRGLARGMRDQVGSNEIVGLQKFLAQRYERVEADIATGYFGPITESLVQRFQSEMGIEAIGLVGPRTRAALAQACQQTHVRVSVLTPTDGTDIIIGDAITVSWTTDNVPTNAGLMLQLTTVDTNEVISSITTTTSASSTFIRTSEMCNGNFSDAIFADCENLKELLKDGKKVAFKIHAAVFTPQNACFGFCAPTTTPTTIHAKGASATFHIRDNAANIFTADTASGKAPLTTTFSINKPGTFTLDFGDGSTPVEVKNPVIQCITTPCITPPKEVLHTYRKAGTYTATLTETVYNDCEPTEEMTCATWFSREVEIDQVTVTARR